MRAAAPLIATVAAAALTTSCTTTPTPPPPATETTPPYVGHPGTPVHATSTTGATADITLNTLTWIPHNCAGSSGCALLDLTLTGTSSQPFRYDETSVIGGFAPSGTTPWTDFRHGNYLGADPTVDYAKAGKLPPLRMGAVTSGQVVHGFVGISLNSRADALFEVVDPGDADNVEAGWQVPA